LAESVYKGMARWPRQARGLLWAQAARPCPNRPPWKKTFRSLTLKAKEAGARLRYLAVPGCRLSNSPEPLLPKGQADSGLLEVSQPEHQATLACVSGPLQPCHPAVSSARSSGRMRGKASHRARHILTEIHCATSDAAARAGWTLGLHAASTKATEGGRFQP